MACHEIAALRLGPMNVLGVDDAAERAHELAELGPLATQPGPLASLAQAADLRTMLELFTASVAELSQRVATLGPTDPKLPYLRSLLVLTRKVELEVRGHIDGLGRLSRELEEMHDYVHELFPVQ